MKYSPIALFTFNRPQHTKNTIRSLLKNPEAKHSKLIIFCDGPRTKKDIPLIQEIKNILSNISGFHSIEIIKRTHNLGLAKSVQQGINYVLEHNDTVICLEDDLVTSPYFLQFMNNSLKKYEDNIDVFSVTGYSFPGLDSQQQSVRFCRRFCSWGWATWKNRWEHSIFDLDQIKSLSKNQYISQNMNSCGNDFMVMLRLRLANLIDSWAILWAIIHCQEKRLCVYPPQSLILNEGHDGSGTHCGTNHKFEVQIHENTGIIKFIDNPIHDDVFLMKLSKFNKISPLRYIRCAIKLFLVENIPHAHEAIYSLIRKLRKVYVLEK